MSLSGNLKDFDISYVFQIVSQEGKTGKLILTTPTSRGAVVFKKGRIVSAGIGRKDIKSMIFQYLHDVRKVPASELQKIDQEYRADYKGAVDHLLASKLVTVEEISPLVEVGLEDLACGLFLWNQGSYRFQVDNDVDHFEILDISVSTDAVTMEAARRVDEWSRTKEAIRPHTVFILADPGEVGARVGPEPSPFDDIPEYLTQFIDGSSSVEFLCSRVFLSDYKVYEALNELLESQRITPLSDKLSTSINAALQRKVNASDSSLTATYLSGLVSVLVAAFIFGMGMWYRTGVLEDKIDLAQARSSAAARHTEMVAERIETVHELSRLPAAKRTESPEQAVSPDL